MSVQQWSRITVQQLEEAKRKLGIPDVGALTEGYAVTNTDPPLRELDAQAATLAQTREVLATLLEDLRAAGVLPDP